MEEEKSQIKKRRRKLKRKRDKERIASAVKEALDVEIPDDMERLRTILEREGIDMTIDNGIAYAMILKALSGDRQAVEWVRETSGERAAEVVPADAVVFISGEEDIPE